MTSYDIKDMIGLTPVNIDQTDYRITFTFSNGATGHFYHCQECCERVEIEDVNGDWADLIGHPLLVADERVSDDHDGVVPDGLCASDESNTWTFYTFRSIGGSVDVRWHGSSNGCYSESVYFDFEVLE